MSTHNIGFYEDLTKIIFEISSNTHLFSSAGGNSKEGGGGPFQSPSFAKLVTSLTGFLLLYPLEIYSFTIQTSILT